MLSAASMPHPLPSHQVLGAPDGQTIRIKVRLPDGSQHELEAPEGYRVMEVIRDWGLPIKAECGGAGACATCHVRIAPSWVDRLIPAHDDENAKLDEVHDVCDRSRLSCQILTSHDIDGLELELSSGSMSSETYWVAG